MSQEEFTALENFLINREVPLLFKCKLILLWQVLWMLLLFIKIVPLPVRRFSRQCYFYVMIGVVLFDWGNYFPYFLKSIYIVLDIICSTMNNYQIRFFSNSGSDIINEVICWMLQDDFSLSLNHYEELLAHSHTWSSNHL